MTADDYVLQAKKKLSAGNADAAVISLKQAISTDARHEESRLLLAKIYLDIGDGKSAVKELNRANKLKVKQEVLAGLMVEALFMAQEYQATVDYVDELLPNVKSKQLERFTFYQAWALLEMGNLPAAKQLLENSDWDDRNEYTLVADLMLAFIDGKIDDLTALSQTILRNASVFDDSLWLVGKLNYIGGRFAEATQAVEEYTKRKPEFVPAVFLLAKSLMQENKTESAQHYIEQLLQATPDEPVTNLLAATLAFQTEQYKQAFDYAIKTIQISGNNVQSQLLAGMSAFKLGNTEDAFFYLDPIEPYLSEGHMARRAYLATLIKLNKTDKAFELLSADSMVDEEARALLDTASIQLIEQGETEKGEVLLAKSADLNSNEDTGYFSGVAKLLQGDQEGLDILLALSEAEPDNQIVKLSIASALIAQKRLEEASDYLANITGDDNVQRTRLALIARIALANNDNLTAANTYKELLNLEPSNADANLYFARAKMDEEAYEQALTYIDNILEASPAHLKALVVNTAIHEALGTTQQALDALAKATASTASTYPVQLLYAETLYRNGFQTRALSELDAMFAKFDHHNNRFWQLYAVAVKKLRSKDYLPLLEQWKAALPALAEPNYRLAEFYLATRQFELARTFIDQGLTLAPDDPALNLLLADWLVSTKQLTKARMQLEGLNVPSPYAPAKDGIEGKLDYYAGDYESALPKVTRFYEHSPTMQYAMLLRAVLLKLKKPEQSITLLEQHLKAFPADNLIRVTLANQVSRTNKERAIALYKEALEYSPKAEDAYKALTNLYASLGQNQDALEYAEQWLALDDKNHQALNKNGTLLLAIKPDRLAVKRLRLAHEAMPTNIIYAMDYAEGLIKIGETAPALKLLEQLGNPLPAFRKRIEDLRALAQKAP